MKSSRDFLLGFITGVVAGILTAPKSGHESRQWIQDEADKRTKDLQDQWSKGVEQVKTQVEQVKSQVNQWTGKLHDEGDQKKEKFNEKVDQVADKAHGGVESAKQSIKVD